MRNSLPMSVEFGFISAFKKSLERVNLKIIGKEFQKIVIRRFLERSIQKKFFPTYTHYK